MTEIDDLKSEVEKLKQENADLIATVWELWERQLFPLNIIIGWGKRVHAEKLAKKEAST